MKDNWFLLFSQKPFFANLYQLRTFIYGPLPCSTTLITDVAFNPVLVTCGPGVHGRLPDHTARHPVRHHTVHVPFAAFVLAEKTATAVALETKCCRIYKALIQSYLKGYGRRCCFYIMYYYIRYFLNFVCSLFV